MNTKIILVGAIAFLAGALIAGLVVFGMMNSQAVIAEAHAQAADERAQTCEAKFQKQTVIYSSSAAPAIGMNLLGGLVRLSPGASLTSALGNEQPTPEYVIPAMVVPRRVNGASGEFYTWVDKNGRQEGPYDIR
jgi:hypothetical protein